MSGTNRPSIASVTVVYNAEHIVGKQLDALVRQSYGLDEIIVVDNGSTDNTARLVSTRYPGITLLSLPCNTGVGGALSTGLDYAALRKKYDWVWLLDDDSVPRHDALEELVKGLGSLNGAADTVGILASLPVHSGKNLSYPGLLWKNGWIAPDSDRAAQNVSFVDAVISSGTLIRGQAVARAGLPRADFFMDFVDFEHCLRLRRHGYAVGVVRSSVLEHEIGSPREIRFMGRSFVWADHAPFREFYLWRNYIFTIWNYYPNWRSKFFVLRRFFRHAAVVALLGKRRLSCLRMMYLGLRDGRAGKLGIRFANDSINV